MWHSLATNASGSVVIAGSCDGQVYVSHDSGATWTAGNSPNAVCWISSALTATGDTIYAAQYSGGLYRSRDFGTTWSQVTTSPLISSGSGINFESVAVSQDGTRIAVAIQNSSLVQSSDSGATWHIASFPDNQPTHWWRWVSMSPDGKVIVAVSHEDIFRSTDAGATWQRLTVAVNGTAVADKWYRVKTSADGQVIAVVGNNFAGAQGTGVYVSRDGGATWGRGYALVADYSFLAMSADGKTIAATVSDTGATSGRVLLSRDSGVTFTVQTMPGSDTDWRAIAMSSAADLVFAATGLFTTHTAGLIYTGH